MGLFSKKKINNTDQYFIVKVTVEEIYKVKAKDSSIAEALAGSLINSSIISREELSKLSVLVKDPFNHENEKGEEISKSHGSLFTMKKFKESVKAGGFTDYDGIGNYSDGKKTFHQILTVTQLDDTYSHVMWYNR
jgi:hypothetical protein